MNTNHIFFHNDIDGIISAALYMHYNKNQKCRLYPVTSIMRGKKFDDFFTQIVKGKDDKKIILDYQYNKNADLWIDHHFNTELGDCTISSEKINYNPKALSAAGIVDSVLSKTHLFPDLIEDVDVIDSCSYKSVNEIFKDTKPIMVLNAYIEQMFPNDMVYCRIVEMINSCNLNIFEANYLMRINSYYVKELEKSAMKIKNSIVISKWISIVNQKRENQYPRYSEYLVNPELKYCIRITNIGNGNVKVSIGYNKWHILKNEFNIGKTIGFDYVQQSGGHFNVGSALMKETYVDRFIDDISKILNKEDDLEKYAVDKEDPVEKKAEELVKTGEVKNISEGRKEASKLETAVEEGVDGSAQVQQL